MAMSYPSAIPTEYDDSSIKSSWFFLFFLFLLWGRGGGVFVEKKSWGKTAPMEGKNLNDKNNARKEAKGTERSRKEENPEKIKRTKSLQVPNVWGGKNL